MYKLPHLSPFSSSLARLCRSCDGHLRERAATRVGVNRLRLRLPVLASFLIGCWVCLIGLTSVESQEQENSGTAAIAEANQEVGESTKSNEEWQRLVADLQASEYARRERASKQLGATDFSALVHVLPLMTSTDAEVAWRAKEVLTRQGIQGSADVVRRIGLVLKLLTAAGHREFAEEAERFESRVASLRLAEASRRLESVPGITLVPGPLLGLAGKARGNMRQFRGNVIIVDRGLRVGPQVRILNGNLIDEPVLEAVEEGADPSNGREPQQGGGADAPAAASERPVEGGADDRVRQSHLKDNLNAWLAKCITASPSDLRTLERSWQESGLIPVGNGGSVPPIQSFDMTINGDLSNEQVQLLSDFFRSPVVVTLVMSGVDMSPELQALIVETAEGGKLQYLSTLQCAYDLKTCIALMNVLKSGGLGYWQTQGRAMLGIMSDDVFSGRDLTEDVSPQVGEVTKGSAAEKAGIQSGDFVRRINDVPVGNFEELRRIVSAFGVGDKIQVEVARGPANMTLEVELQEYRHQ